MEIYGSISARTKSLGRAPISGAHGATWLGGTSVTIAGQPAYISYVSGGQLNMQVPSNIIAGAQDLVVTTDTGVSQTYSVNVDGTVPGLYSPQHC